MAFRDTDLCLKEEAILDKSVSCHLLNKEVGGLGIIGASKEGVEVFREAVDKYVSG